MVFCHILSGFGFDRKSKPNPNAVYLSWRPGLDFRLSRKSKRIRKHYLKRVPLAACVLIWLRFAIKSKSRENLKKHRVDLSDLTSICDQIQIETDFTDFLNICSIRLRFAIESESGLHFPKTADFAKGASICEWIWIQVSNQTSSIQNRWVLDSDLNQAATPNRSCIIHYNDTKSECD